jgi:hypothetical protein
MIYRRKYGNKKVTFGGETFDSKGEWERWLFLKDAESKGIITDLRKQVEFTLVPSQFKDMVIHLKTKDKTEKRLAEHSVRYIADFVYLKDGETVVEDFKGQRTDAYIIKRKLMLFFNGIAIREVKKPTEPI